MSGVVRKLHKTLQIQGLANVFKDNSVVVVAHTTAMDVSQFNGLKMKCMEIGMSTRMSKNSLAKVAIKETRYRTLSPLFEGPTQLFYGNDSVRRSCSAAAPRRSRRPAASWIASAPPVHSHALRFPLPTSSCHLSRRACLSS